MNFIHFCHGKFLKSEVFLNLQYDNFIDNIQSSATTWKIFFFNPKKHGEKPQQNSKDIQEFQGEYEFGKLKFLYMKNEYHGIIKQFSQTQ